MRLCAELRPKDAYEKCIGYGIDEIANAIKKLTAVLEDVSQLKDAEYNS
jgi:hypothetical protein